VAALLLQAWVGLSPKTLFEHVSHAHGSISDQVTSAERSQPVLRHLFKPAQTADIMTDAELL